jgi:tRNA threonylcarbamoyladenosine biosynthesis protein TsaE
VIIDSHSEADTIEAGRMLAGQLAAGDVLLLYGDLGAGKTAFVRGLVRGLGGPEDEVTSPTFTLVQEYRRGRLPLFHADLYRLTATEAADLGLHEIGEDGVLAIEWADRLAGPPPPAITIRIDTISPDVRRIAITPADGGAPGRD